MEKHILTLLNTNLRVIIPDFGAFIIRQKEPLILVFNEFLRYNDGLLIDYIAKQENIDKDIARHQVTEYTENLVKALETKKEVKLEGIGTLQKSGEDKIEFIQAGKEIPKRAAKKVQEKKPEVAKEEDSITLEINPEDSKTVVKTGVEVKPENTKNGTPQNKKAETKAETTKSAEPKPEKPESKPSIEKPTPVGSAKKPVSQPNAEIKPKAAEKPQPIPPVAKPPVAKPPVKTIPEKKNKKHQIAWITLVVLAVALINAWFIFNDQIKTFFNAQKFSKPVADTLGQMVEPDDTIMDETNADGTVKTQEIIEDDFYAIEETAKKTETSAPVKETVQGEKKYYIVAGCFRDEINAEDMVKKLKQKGYNAQKFGTIGNLYAVSYSSFTDKEKAHQELERIRKEVAPEAWMVHY